MVAKFRNSFDPFQSHDAYKFMAHILNGVTRETVSADIIKAWSKGKVNSDIYKYFENGIINNCFGILLGSNTKCQKGH